MAEGGKALFLAAGMPDYRTGFHTQVRARLESRGVTYDVAVSPPKRSDLGKIRFADLPFAIPVRDTRLHLKGAEMIWQHALGLIGRYDLVILEQANRFLLNHLLQAAPKALRPRLALFGHGRNFQGDEATLRERFKATMLRRADWWFAYAPASRDLMIARGVEPDRITTFYNSIDMTALKLALDAVTPVDVEAFNRAHGLLGARIGLFIGGLYGLKRLDFLVAAGEAIRAEVADFELVIAGDGPLRADMEAAAASRPWLRYIGQVGLAEKAVALKAAKVVLMPGGVGLVVLDAFAAGRPMITTDNQLHGPEIGYLTDGVSGVISGPAEDLDAYRGAVVEALLDEAGWRRLASGAAAAAPEFSVERMAERFADGVVQALAAPRSTRRVDARAAPV